MSTTERITEHPAIEKIREELRQALDEELRAELDEVEEYVITGYTLADAIREGSTVTEQHRNGWLTETKACALSAAYLAAKARGYV